MSHCCRHCGSPLVHEVIDLGHQPPSNAYLTEEQLKVRIIAPQIQNSADKLLNIYNKHSFSFTTESLF